MFTFDDLKQHVIQTGNLNAVQEQELFNFFANPKIKIGTNGGYKDWWQANWSPYQDYSDFAEDAACLIMKPMVQGVMAKLEFEKIFLSLGGALIGLIKLSPTEVGYRLVDSVISLMLSLIYAIAVQIELCVQIGSMGMRLFTTVGAAVGLEREIDKLLGYPFRLAPASSSSSTDSNDLRQHLQQTRTLSVVEENQLFNFFANPKERIGTYRHPKWWQANWNPYKDYSDFAEDAACLIMKPMVHGAMAKLEFEKIFLGLGEALIGLIRLSPSEIGYGLVDSVCALLFSACYAVMIQTELCVQIGSMGIRLLTTAGASVGLEPINDDVSARQHAEGPTSAAPF